MKILIIEDEIDLLSSMKEYLSESGYICESAVDIQEASQRIWDNKYDHIILDVMLPGGSGIELISEIKQNQTSCGIIIVSAKDSLDDRLKGLDLGADDYITKPFHFAELNSRLKALNRRRNFDGEKKVVFNEIELYPDERIAKVSGTNLDLTGKEFDLLMFLIANKNRTVTKETIAEHLWGDIVDTYDNFDFIYTHIRNVRKKLNALNCTDYIHTVYGFGYKFSEK